MKGIAPLAALVVSAALAVPGISSGQSPALPTVDVAVGGGPIAVTGALQSGASTVKVTNTGKEPTSVTLVRLNEGVTAEALIAALPDIAQDPNEIDPYGSIRYDASAAPGTSTVDTVLAAGDYVAFESTDDPTKGTHAEFTIAKAATEAALPAAARTIAAIDFAFKGPKKIARGSTVRFQQQGNVAHMILGLKVKNAFVAKQAVRFLRAGKDKKVEKLVRGAASFMDPASQGAVQQATVTAQPGTYVLACFLPTQDRRPHTRLGMARTLKVTK